MSGPLQNYSLRDQIRDYWAVRADSYDAGRGHGIAQNGERDAWLDLLNARLGPGDGRSALDLATGTGEIALLMHAAGFVVTGMDFTEPMLERAMVKAATHDLPIRFLLRDVEHTREPDESYDVLVTRNLVWTLVDPSTALAEWYRVLKPGGRLLIVDGDHVSVTWADRLQKLWARWFGTRTDGHSMLTAEQWANHHAIVAQLPFSQGARAKAVVALLQRAGFAEMAADTDMTSLRKFQAQGQGWIGWLRSKTRHRFVICCSKPRTKT